LTRPSSNSTANRPEGWNEPRMKHGSSFRDLGPKKLGTK
jgi:hypothetical protein